jgi:hypothetical protein
MSNDRSLRLSGLSYRLLRMSRERGASDLEWSLQQTAAHSRKGTVQGSAVKRQHDRYQAYAMCPAVHGYAPQYPKT